ncbi:hypothetical protein CCR97_24270 [Rhodoplanes elegans]|uniref:Peptidoglycan binding-like domain-containing protein n=1 Tax=Rhodoplanes elegans TaxID=29408 RepID=A0A327KSW2_9BRAD|nr:peptidoglycan-binding protein [Rhodoplanes elegans]MBK5961297.1 hypothetical protein [Rhodoplanes elegans]RAI41929.1 hypothetical protein CH338_01685 [Rhodoplanes elegans]
MVGRWRSAVLPLVLGALVAPLFAFAGTYGSGGYGAGSYAGAAPIVTTQAASSIDQATATLNGTITDVGTTSPSVRGFVYGTTASYGATTTDSAGPFSTGAFTVALTGLTCNTTYHFAAYATSTNGIGYGSDASFTTSACSSGSAGGGGGGGGGGSSGGNGPIAGSIPASSGSPQTASSSASTTRPAAASVAAPATDTVTPTTCTSNGATFTRNLGRGAKGDDVRRLQVFLNTHGFEIAATGDGSPGHETGEYGAKTEAALIHFQEANALAINLVKFTGFFGEATRSYVNSVLRPACATTTASSETVSASPSPLPGANFTRDLEHNATGEDVRALQQFLNAAGFTVAASGNGSPGNETTTFGPATRRALAKFQAANGIAPASGFFGPKTRAFINAGTSTVSQ